MKIFLAVINLIIISAHADVTVDLGRVDLSSAIGKVRPLYNPLQPNDLIAVKNTMDHVEWLRSKFGTGTGYMPPLDPYHIEKMKPIPFKKGVVNGYIVLSNLRVEGGKSFQVNLIELRMSIDTVNGDIVIPKIVGNVDFDAEVTVGILPLSIKGHLQTTLTGVKVNGVFGSTETNVDSMQVYQVTADALKISADDVQITLSKMSVDADKHTVLEWWGKLKDEIMGLVNTAVVDQVNDIIKHYSSQQVRDFLLNGA